jgi:hypothetical protein
MIMPVWESASSTGVSARDIAVPEEGNPEKVNLVEVASRLLRSHRVTR